MSENRQLDLLDAAIMIAMATRPAGIMTYVVRNVIEMEHGYGSVSTATVLRRLKRMEAAGVVERVRSSYAVMLCWRRKTV
ncbi:hypothetical protein [Sphingomonas melonis]|uniref:hypothetical protein n=1 Tax=Sphingomonas melonis TaxID=152682 RepID=UPI0035C7A4CD